MKKAEGTFARGLECEQEQLFSLFSIHLYKSNSDPIYNNINLEWLPCSHRSEFRFTADSVNKIRI